MKGLDSIRRSFQGGNMLSLMLLISVLSGKYLCFLGENFLAASHNIFKNLLQCCLLASIVTWYEFFMNVQF